MCTCALILIGIRITGGSSNENPTIDPKTRYHPPCVFFTPNEVYDYDYDCDYSVPPVVVWM